MAARSKIKQKRNPLLIIIAVVVLVIGGYAAFQYFTKPVIIQSADGGLTLELPRSVLLKHPDIRVEQSLPDEKEASDVISSYKLLPDGLTFQKPVKVTLSVKNAKGTIPVTYHISDGAYEELENVETAIDMTSKRTSIRGEISHFSTLVTTDGFFHAQNYEISDQVVGKPFNVVLIVTLLQDKIKNPYYPPILGTREETMHRPWQLGGWLSLRNADVLEPWDIRNLPAEGTLIPGVAWEGKGNFVCARSGLAALEYTFSVDGTITRREEDTDGKVTSSTRPYHSGKVILFPNLFRCLSPEKPTSTPAPTRPATQTGRTAHPVSFEFYDASGQRTVGYTSGGHIVIIGLNVGGGLPTTMFFYGDGVEIGRVTIENDPKNCRDVNTCSKDGIKIAKGKYKEIRIEVYDSKGNNIGSYTQPGP